MKAKLKNIEHGDCDKEGGGRKRQEERSTIFKNTLHYELVFKDGPSCFYSYLFEVQFFDKQWEKEFGIYFKLYCPGQYGSYPHKLMMYQNGTVGTNIRYQDVCTDINIVNIAYGYSWMVVNNSMVEWVTVGHNSGHGDRVGVFTSIPYPYEIFHPFFEKYNIIANWTDCNYTLGTYNNETGKYTGVIGQVNLF